MALTVLVAACLVVIATLTRVDPVLPRRGALYWWTVSAFGVQAAFLVLLAVLPQMQNVTVGLVFLAPMDVVGVVMVVGALRRGARIGFGAILCAAPLVVSCAFVVAGFPIMAIVQGLVVMVVAVVQPAEGYDRRQLMVGLRDSLLSVPLVLLVLLVAIGPALLGPCRFDKCSWWGTQIGETGSANALGVSLAFVGVIVVHDLPWWRLVTISVSVALLVDLCSSRSALVPLGVGLLAVVVERTLGGSLRTFARATLLAGAATAITACALIPLPSDTFSDRGGLWSRARELIAARPLTGWGISYWVRQDATTTFDPNYAAHNLLLELGVSFGVVGAAAVLAGVALSRLDVPPQARTLWFVCVIAWLSGGVTEVLSAPGRVYLLPAAYLLPLILASGRQSRAPSDARDLRRSSSRIPEMREGLTREVDPQHPRARPSTHLSRQQRPER